MKYTRAEIELPPLDDLFSTQEMRDDALREKIQTIPLQDLYPFQNHPFKVQDNAELQKMAESRLRLGISQLPASERRSCPPGDAVPLLIDMYIFPICIPVYSTKTAPGSLPGSGRIYDM